MDIIVLKLATGEEVLGEMQSQTVTDVTIVNPVGISIVRGKDGGPNIGFSPFPLHAEQKKGTTIAFAKSNVVYSYVPAQDFIDNYNQIFGSGIVLPPTKKLITG
jgi:hypothetical protein